MNAFTMGVVTSICATVICTMLARFGPRRVRTLLFGILSTLLGCNICHIYENEGEAAEDILREAADSTSVRVLSIRGMRLTSEDRPLSKLIRPGFCKGTVEVMLADRDSVALEARAAGFALDTCTYSTNDRYKQDVIRSLNVLHEVSKKNPNLSVRTHHEPQSFRIIFTDEHAFLSFFPKGRSGSTSRVHKIPRKTDLYHALEEHYCSVRQNRSKQYNGEYVV